MGEKKVGFVLSKEGNLSMEVGFDYQIRKVLSEIWLMRITMSI